jgi:NSS family neurotransmitter:Na+ symporter
MDTGLTRKAGTLIIVGACLFLGAPSAIFPSFLDNQDWVWGVALLISGFFVILAVWKYGADRIRTDLINPSADIKMGAWWSFIIKYISPLVFLGLTGWWFYRGIADNPGSWWKPFATSTTGTIIMQWGVLVLVLLLGNKLLVKWTKKAPEEEN